MDMGGNDAVWIRDKIIDIERELGGYAERHRALEQSDSLIRAEVREGFARQERAISDGLNKLATDMSVSSAHMRGEINRLTDALAQERSEMRVKIDNSMMAMRDNLQSMFENTMSATIRQSQEQVRAQRASELEDQHLRIAEELESGRKNIQVVVIVLGILIVGIEKIIEWLPQLLAGR